MKQAGSSINHKISFHFHPKGFDKNEHVVERADNSGNKRRYICGIASGLDVDAHGERMTEKCIKSFMSQANAGEILLYADIHGIKASEDIGILTKSEILQSGDWYIENRLYDQFDEVGPIKLEKADTIWKQMNGLPPYSQKRQRGFSIEGIIPVEAVVANSSGQIDRSVIDDVSLDGVVLVPRPAYKDSIAIAVTKALGEVSPMRENSIKETLRETVEVQEIRDKYWKYKWQYHDALERSIEKIMQKKNNNKQKELEILFDEYKELMVDLVLESASLFVEEDPDSDSPQVGIANSIYGASGHEVSRLEIFKGLAGELIKLKSILEKNPNEYRK